QSLVIADGLQPSSAGGPVLDCSDAGAGGRVLKSFAEVAIEVHDALLGFGARLRGGLGDVDRRSQKDLALPRMSARLPAFAVSFDVRSELGQRAQANCDKHAMAEPANCGKRVGAVGGNADFGPRFLIGFGSRSDVFEGIILAGIGKRILGPRFL